MPVPYQVLHRHFVTEAEKQGSRVLVYLGSWVSRGCQTAGRYVRSQVEMGPRMGAASSNTLEKKVKK